ncbi:MAG: DinB family protein [candidate division Zixibacteria bacterium]|nr:DinB family protein [candidate division Zixibacteria bacterium]
MTKEYRDGGVGAMMDEYERAAAELKNLLGKVSEADYNRIVDTETKDEDCRSIQTIIRHVVGAGYGYAFSIRQALSIPYARPETAPVSHQEAVKEIDTMLKYTVETLEGRWEMKDDEIERLAIKTRWGAIYNLEQLLEHAIVHILRHRRQIERFLLRIKN